MTLLFANLPGKGRVRVVREGLLINKNAARKAWAACLLKSIGQASVPRDVFPPTPPGPEGSNGNGLLRVQWAAGAWLSSI